MLVIGPVALLNKPVRGGIPHFVLKNPPTTTAMDRLLKTLRTQVQNEAAENANVVFNELDVDSDSDNDHADDADHSNDADDNGV